MIASFDQKPAKIGMPTSASEPIRKVARVYGIDLRQPAHLADVLLPVQVMDDEPGGEEEERLEERVGDEVEHREPVGSDAGADEHVADLAHRRVRDHALDVPLDERDDTRDEEGRQPEERGEVLHVGRALEDRVRAADEVDARRDHRRGVDQGGDGRRALHRVGEPGVERDLRGLRDGASEQAEREERHGGVREAAVVDGGEHGPVVEAADLRDREEEGQRHHRVADRVHHERLLRGGDGRRALVVEPDQEVRREPDEPPADEQQEQVAALDEQEHREDEERHVGEVPPLLVVAGHVAVRVEDDQAADAGDDEHHHDRERVDQELEPDLELACLEPRPRRRQLGAVVGIASPGVDERGDRPGEAHEHRCRGDDARPAPRDPRPGEQDDEEAGERREEADPAAVDHR